MSSTELHKRGLSTHPWLHHREYWIHSYQCHVPCVPTWGMQRVWQTYVGNGPEIRHGFCCLCHRKHLEECSLPGGWDISTCEHFSHHEQQSVQKIIRRMFQKFSNKSQIITGFFALQTGGNVCSLIPQHRSCNQAICVPPVAAKLEIYFHCGYARKMAAEPLKLKQPFFLCSIATRCSAICVPDRPIEPLLLQLFVQIEGYHQRSVGPVKMPCYRQGQNHISVFPHFVSKLTFPVAIHCKTNAGSAHILVALRRGWEKDCCCYVHLALLPIGWNKSTAKSKSDGQKRHDHVTQATVHSNSPCQKPSTNLVLQSTLEFPCPKPCPKIMLQSASVHPSADVFGNRVVLPADVLPAVLQCDPKSWRQTFYTTNGCLQWAWNQMVVEPAPSSPASEKASCSNTMENYQWREYHWTNAISLLGNHQANFSEVLPPNLPHQLLCAFSSDPPHIEVHALTTGFLSDWLGGTVCLDFLQKFDPTCLQRHLAAGFVAAWTLWLQIACSEVFASSLHVPTAHLTYQTSIPELLACGFCEWQRSIFFFSSLLFSAKSRFWTETVVLVSLHATKWLFYWSVSRRRRGGGQIQAMLLKRGWGSAGGSGSRGMWARISPRGGKKPSTLLWEEVSSHNKLAARAVKVAWAKRADHLAMRAAVTAWRKGSGLWRALALARWRMNPAASSLQRPPASTPKTTKRFQSMWIRMSLTSWRFPSALFPCPNGNFAPQVPKKPADITMISRTGCLCFCECVRRPCPSSGVGPKWAQSFQSCATVVSTTTFDLIIPRVASFRTIGKRQRTGGIQATIHQTQWSPVMFGQICDVRC